MSPLKKAIIVFLISILPVVELRGAIPVAFAYGLPFYVSFLLSVFGNLLPIPFILLFIPRLLDFLARFKFFRPIVGWLRKKADKNRDRVIKDQGASEEISDSGADMESKSTGERKMNWATFLGLLLFVAIPLPMTGAWTGALVASLFNLPRLKSFLAVVLGVLVSGTIVTLICYGVLGFLSFLL